MKRMIIRGVVLCAVVLLGISSPVWVFVPVALLYALLYTAPELLLIAFLIDIYFGSSEGFGFWYVFAVMVILLFAEYIKPRLWVYNNE